MQISVFGFLGDAAGRSPVDVYVEELARARDECFSRVWTAQLPPEPDLLVALAVAQRDVPDINVGTAATFAVAPRPQNSAFMQGETDAADAATIGLTAQEAETRRRRGEANSAGAANGKESALASRPSGVAQAAGRH